MTQQVEAGAAVRTSRLGKIPIPIPKGVTVKLEGDVVKVKGAKGELTWNLPPATTLEIKDEKVHVVSQAPGRDAPRLQGLARAVVANMVKGTSEGFTKTLELVGTGYRAEVKGKNLHMALGFSHPIVYPIPQGVSIVVPQDSKGTQVVVSGADRALVGQVAARIRDMRPPEPYGGKGVRYRGERVREKAGKAGKGAR